MTRIIETDADVAEGAVWLAARCPRLCLALEQTGPLPLRPGEIVDALTEEKLRAFFEENRARFAIPATWSL